MENIYNKSPLGIRKDGSSYTAVVVDDSNFSRLAIKQILLSLKFNVIDEIDNGAKAVLLVREGKINPDYMFIDFEMPVMNGMEVVKNVRPLLKNTKIVMVTTISSKEKVDELISLGVNGYIKKPYDRDTVIKQLEKLV